MKDKIGLTLAAALLAVAFASPADARNGMMGGAPRFVPYGHYGFHGGYRENYGFRRDFGHGPGFGFYSYPYTPFYANPCTLAIGNPYRCDSYQFGY